MDTQPLVRLEYFLVNPSLVTHIEMHVDDSGTMWFVGGQKISMSPLDIELLIGSTARPIDKRTHNMKTQK